MDGKKLDNTGDMGEAERLGNYHNCIPEEHVYDGMIMPGLCFPASALDEIKRFQLHKDDVLLATFARSGTTWTNEMLYLILNDVDLKKAQSAPIHERIPFLEFGHGKESGVEVAKTMKPPRHLKTHLPARYFEKQIREGRSKTIVVFRNPKDTMVSFHSFYKLLTMLGNTEGTFDQFLEMMYARKAVWGDWFDHNRDWWALRDQPNVLALMYEDMKMDPERAVRSLADFVGKRLTDEQVNTIVEHTSFATMKKNPATNYTQMQQKGVMDFTKSAFIRKGEVGGWRDVFTVAQNERFEAYYNERMKGCDIKFRYEI